jgi:hypothetical protein
MIYSPTDLQREIRDKFRAEKLSIGSLVTDQQIYDAVSHVLTNPNPKFGNDDTMFWTRVKLCTDFAGGINKLKRAEGENYE